MTAPFAGIPADAFEFYEELATDPTKAWWTAHKEQYVRNVREPLVALAEQLEPEFGEPHLFRPYRDVRFSKDKTPYKDHQGLYVDLRNGVGWYLQVSASGLMVAGGLYQPDPGQLRRFRAAAGSDEGARMLDAFAGDLTASGLELQGDLVATRPRGVPADHPHLQWLRHKNLIASRTWEPHAWVGTTACRGRVEVQWRHMRPLMEWLADAAGPSQ